MRGGRQFNSRWFRVYDDLIDDPKVQTLSDKLVRFLLSCWCLASKHGGYLPPISMIAWKLRKSEAAISQMIAELNERGLLDEEGDTFQPHNWAARQYQSDSSTQRVRQFRERHRNGNETFQKQDETVSVTAPDTETDTETEQNNIRAPKSGALALVKSASKRSRKPHRSIEEIELSLGERKEWWDWFWKVYPCHEGKRDAMDAYERIVTTHELAAEVYRGAQRYAARIATDPTARVKWAQGWLNTERWKDEVDTRAAPTPPRQRDLVANVSREIQESLLKGEHPW